MTDSSNTLRSADGISRRDFMRLGAGWTVASVVGGGVLLTLSGCSADDAKATMDATFRDQRTITDHAGRQNTIPTVAALKRVYFTSALAQIFVFSLAPEIMAGTSMQFTPEELAYLPEGTDKLPYMGTLSAGGEIDREMLLFYDVQLVIDCSGTGISASDVSTVQKLQDQTGIPSICVDGSFEKIAEAYRFLGEILGHEDRAAEIATYLEKVYNDVEAAVSTIPDNEKVKLYYAEGPLGLQTEPDEGLHAMTFARAGANNVAAVEETQGLGMTNVSLEQVLAWDPEVIVAWDAVIRGGADEIIRSNSDWSSIPAVRNNRVYTMPNAPFAWCDRPPGVNRFLGLQWVANMLYPDRYDVDMVEVVKEFYALVFRCTVNDDQARELLGNSYPPYGKQ